ncbi:MAG: hypothetical protein P9L99_14735 [Candidatus Lernaella stagnicola]|nr:hypothetical protein [Candidatus Lernaella stagnicola]
MKFSLVRYSLLLLLFVLLLLNLPACGDDDDDNDDNDVNDDTTDDDDDSAGDDDNDDDDTIGDDDDDDDTTQPPVWPNEVDCFDENGIKPEVDICQYYATDFVGRDIQKPDQELITALFPDGFEYDENHYWDDLVRGTDLGNNTRVGGATYYFFGDTHPVLQSHQTSGPMVGVPWGVDTDSDYVIDTIAGHDEGIYHYYTVTEFTAFDDNDDPTTLLNQAERDLIFPGGQPGLTEVPFFVPTGLAATEEAIYYWYGKYISNTDCDQSHVLKYDVGADKWSYLAPFANQKFIQVNGIPVTPDDFADTGQCKPPFENDDEQGFILYGSGRPVANSVSFDDATPDNGSYCRTGSQISYRISGLYLAYVREADLSDSTVAAKTYYWVGPDAGCWKQGGVFDALAIDTKLEWGEFSVKRIPNTPYLMFAHSFVDQDAAQFLIDHPEYRGHFVAELGVNVADIAEPWQVSDKLGADAYGYGNYVIDESIDLVPELKIDGEVVEDNVLMFTRVVSTWKGQSNFAEYGTALIWSLLDFDELLSLL